jgi:hypothetical protein
MRKPATDVLGDGFSALRKEVLSSSNADRTNQALDEVVELVAVPGAGGGVKPPFGPRSPLPP